MQKEALECFELSPQQERLWSLSETWPRGRAHCCILLEGPLNADALRGALERVIGRHEIFRSEIIGGQGAAVPAQVIRPDFRLDFEIVDSGPLSEDAQKAWIESTVHEDLRAWGSSSRGPSISAILNRISSDSHLLLICLPFMCADHITFNNLFDELCSYYDPDSRDAADSVESLQYADYSCWSRQLLTGENAEKARAFWDRLDKPPLELSAFAFAVPDPGSSKHSIESLVVRLDGEQSARIEQAAQALCVSEDMFMLVCWLTLLWKVTSQQEIVIGHVADGRVYKEMEAGMGVYARTVPLALSLAEDFTIDEAMGMVAKSLRDISIWQNYYINGPGGPQPGNRSTSRFPVLFEFERWPRRQFQSGVHFSMLDQSSTVDSFELKLTCVQNEEGIRAGFEYDSKRLKRPSVLRLADQFRTLLSNLLSNTEERMGALDIVSDQERNLLLAEFNNTDRDYGEAVCLHTLFERQARANPNHSAVIYEQEEMTYADLDSRADRMAHHLQSLGMGPEDLVAICAERSFELVIGLLAILKAGAAYLPLDPSYPQERISYMLEKSGAGAVLAQPHLTWMLAGHESKVVLLDAESTSARLRPSPGPRPPACPDNLAYVIFTSGSTGRPKGAMNTHRGIVNRLLWMQEAYGLNEKDRVLQKTPYSFDVSVWEFFWPLITGSAMVLARPGGHRDPAYLARLIREQKVTTIHFVPSMLEFFLRDPGASECGSLKRVICSGEALTARMKEEFFERLDCELENLYGPTEAAVDVTRWACRKGSDRKTVPIGSPIANIKIYLLKSDLKPAAIGVPGELYIGGVGVGRGYVNAPALTAERFIPSPFEDQPGERLYKTGDLAFYDPDGKIEFLGRIDHQVKIRGLRVELGEIESVFRSHPSVGDVVVVQREDEPGDKRLVAYLTPSRGQVPVVADLRALLKEKLPEYMTPSAFVVLNELPLTPSGKIDRQSLPPPDQPRGDLEELFVAPRNPLEEVLSDIWAEVLGLDLISVHDNFFELGGHSLMVMRIVVRIRETFQMELPPSVLFEATTVAELAEAMIKHEPKKGQMMKIATLVKKIEAMSEEDASAALARGRVEEFNL